MASTAAPRSWWDRVPMMPPVRVCRNRSRRVRVPGWCWCSRRFGLQLGDQGLPFRVVGEGAGVHCREAGGDLFAAGSGQEAAVLDVDARVGEGRRDPLGEALESVGRVGSGASLEQDVVDLVDQDEAGAGLGADADHGFGEVGGVGASQDRETEEPGELGGDHAGCRGGPPRARVRR